MNEQEQRIAIAEACGWVWYRIPSHWDKDKPLRGLFLPALHEYEGQSPQWLVRADGSERVCNVQFMEKEGHLPDYLNDLNAMHEAEQMLTDDQRKALRVHLMANSDGPKAVFQTVEAALCHATAKQRGEAFLRTLNLWRD